MQQLSYLDLAIVIGFLVACLSIGIYKATKIKTIKEFAVGYKDISVTVLVCIIFASSIGAGSTIGVTGKVYELGAIFVIRTLLLPLVWLINFRFVASNIEQFKDCISISEVMYKLYGMPGRWIAALASLIRSLGVIAAQALALGFVFNYFLGIDTGYGILIGYGIITIYAALGGIKAVIPTEIFKSAIILFIIPISYISIFSTSGGLDSFLYSLPESHTQLKLSKDTIQLLVNLTLLNLLPTFHPAFIQRCLVAKNSAQLKSALKMIAFISVPVSAVFCAIAYKMRADFTDLDSDMVLLHFISMLPAVLKGITVSGLIAIIMSLAEAEINATSVILVNDIIKVVYPNISNAWQLRLLRSMTVILAIASVALVNLAENILGFVWFKANFWGPLISIPALAGFLGFRTNSKSFIVSALTAMFFTVSTGIIVGDFAILSWSFGVLGSTVGLFGMHYYQIIKGRLPLYEWPKTTKASLFTRIINISIMFLKCLTKKVTSALTLLQENPGTHKLNIKKFCTFTLSYYFFYSLNITSDLGHVTFTYLITIGYFFCMVLLFREFIASKKFLERYLHYYWYFLLTFCLPFVSSYMLFIGLNDPFWVINGILSAFSLYLFVDARRFLLMYSVGTCCGFVLFKLSGFNLDLFQEITTASRIAYIYLFFLFATLFFLREREKEQEERVETMHMFGGAMAHEVKSPLATIKMCAETVNKLLQQAFTAEQKKGKVYNITINEEDANILTQFSEMLEKSSMRGIKTVDTLLYSLKNEVVLADKKFIKIKDCISRVIVDYLFLHPERDRIEVNIINNFSFYGSLELMDQVIINLLNNAYKYGGQHVKITIRAEKNKLYFKDNGKGIAEEDLPRIFDRFYTKSKSGTGLGLAFCKKIMEDLDGSIECNSKIGKYTEFILTFPKLKKKAIKT